MDDHAGEASAATATALGNSVAGDVEVPGDVDMFAVELTAGQAIVLRVNRTAESGSAGLADPSLVLQDATGHILAMDDDSGGEFNARVFYSIEASGTYYAAVTDHDQGTGTYELSIHQTTRRSGSDLADSLVGGTLSDTVEAGAGNDQLTGLTGDDLLDGGLGFDIARYEGPLANFFIEPVDVSGWASTASRGWVLTDSIGTEGSDVLVSIERVAFADHNLALDLDGNAGTVAKVLGAVFGADAIYDPVYVGVGLQLADSGIGLNQLMDIALAYRLGAQPSSTQVVDLLFTNVVGHAPTNDERQPFTDMLDSGALTMTELGALAAEHPLNLANIDFVGLADYGIVYTT